MISFGLRTHGAKNRRQGFTREQVPYFVGEWMESGDDEKLSPTTFLAEMVPNAVTRPHFHRNNQFQVFVSGEGEIGRHAASPLLVHYAGAYTAYGPLTAKGEGLQYFTMRPVREEGAQYLPECRNDILQGPRRHLSSKCFSPCSDDELKALRTITSVDVLAPQKDGIVARRVMLPSLAKLTASSPAGTGGQIYMVLSGTVCCNDQTLGLWEHVFISEDEDSFRLQAGEAGADVLMLQFPLLAQAYSVAATRPTDPEVQSA